MTGGTYLADLQYKVQEVQDFLEVMPEECPMIICPQEKKDVEKQHYIRKIN